MKKSEMFKKAQIAVVNDNTLRKDEKLEILGVLMSEEIVQRMLENNKTEIEPEGEQESEVTDNE